MRGEGRGVRSELGLSALLFSWRMRRSRRTSLNACWRSLSRLENGVRHGREACHIADWCGRPLFQLQPGPGSERTSKRAQRGQSPVAGCSAPQAGQLPSRCVWGRSRAGSLGAAGDLGRISAAGIDHGVARGMQIHAAHESTKRRKMVSGVTGKLKRLGGL